MIITLLALVILMIGGVALIRSMNTSLLMAGNLSFKRDLVNQAERGVAQALTLLQSGALSAEAARQSNAASSNYSAVVLATNAKGVPSVLVDDSLYTSGGWSAADISDTAAGITVRYVIDRQCVAGTTAFASSKCMLTATKADKGGSAQLATKKPGGDLRPVYRISVRVKGPRGTEAYVQTTVTL